MSLARICNQLGAADWRAIQNSFFLRAASKNAFDRKINL
jgi:hypothetical protein